MSLYAHGKGPNATQPKVTERGNSPKVTPLPNGRLQVVRRFDIHVPEEVQHNEFNSEKPEDLTIKVFGGYGLLDGTSLQELPDNPTGEEWSQSTKRKAYKDCRLIDEVCDPGQDAKWILTQIYETLTSTWELEDKDIWGATDNGLKQLTRTQVARRNTDAPFTEEDIGSETITINGKKLTLSGVEDKSSDRQGRFVTRWAEPGQLRLRKSFDLDGLETLTYQFIGTEGTTDGRVIDRDIGNFQGFRTFMVRTLRKIGGSTVVDNEVAETFSTYAPFTYPGVANAVEVTVTSSPLRKIYDVELDQPVTADIPATVEIRYQNDADVGTLPHTFWNPKKWAKVAAYWLSNNLEPTSKYQSLNGYRTGVDTKTYTGGATQVAFLGRFVYAPSGASATILISGGPSNPVGNTYVIARPRVEHAFTEVEPGGGIVKWYKRTIVYANIPAQT